ncbi:GIY-YIG nuclease family protein [Nocardia tengchongensis]|uniref:GIY-YIG nuclease family protein n=1 Tax=Nocardia tengchongensis TaxID=2055889 RepID=UPI00367D45D7
MYVMENPAFPGKVKVGRTDLLAEDRASKLSSHEGVPLPFTVAFRAATMRPHAVENLAHNNLDHARVNQRREFFEVSVAEATQAVREAIFELDGIDAWRVGEIHPIGARDRVALALSANEVFVHLRLGSLFTGAWEIQDLWQAHSEGDQLEIYGANSAQDVSGLSDNDSGSTDDPVPYLDRGNKVANGMLIGKESLAPGDRVLWMSDHEDDRSCTPVLFEARDYCQIANRTWSPVLGSNGLPQGLIDLVRDRSKGMELAIRTTMRLPGPRNWGPPPPPRDRMPPLPSPEHWLPQLKPKRRR